MVLVVDAAKGIQTQTAECIVIGEVAAGDLVVALNKIGGRALYARGACLGAGLHANAASRGGCWPRVCKSAGCPPADQFPEEKRERYCRKAQKLVAATLDNTKFRGCPIVPVAVRPAASSASAEPTGDAAGAAAGAAPVGVQQLVETLLQRLRLQQGAELACSGDAGSTPKSFLFYIDHCFAIKGQGTVMTGELAGLYCLLCGRNRCAA